MSGLFVKNAENAEKFMFFFFFFFFFCVVTPFWPGSFSGNTTDSSIINTLPELL